MRVCRLGLCAFVSMFVIVSCALGQRTASCGTIRADHSTGWLSSSPTQPVEISEYLEQDSNQPNSSALPIPLRDASCIRDQKEIRVRNYAKVSIHTAGYDAADCKTSIDFKPDEQADLVALFAKILQTSGGMKALSPFSSWSIPPARNGTVTVKFTCGDTAKQAVVPVTIIIHYTDGGSHFSGSGGALTSLLGKKNYGNITSETAGSSSAGGAVTTQNVFGIKATSAVQFVPMAFVNWRPLGHGGKLSGDLQAGVGINPNGTKVQVEYFLGPALGIGRVLISPGVHIAKAEYPDSSSGFHVGDIVPGGTTVPTIFRTTFRFGIALSFVPKVSTK